MSDQTDAWIPFDEYVKTQEKCKECGWAMEWHRSPSVGRKLGLRCSSEFCRKRYKGYVEKEVHRIRKFANRLEQEIYENQVVQLSIDGGEQAVIRAVADFVAQTILYGGRFDGKKFLR